MSQFDQTTGKTLPVEGLDGYLVYEDGSVVSFRRSKPLKLATRTDPDGYLRVALWNRAKGRNVGYGIHRLLMLSHRYQDGCEKLVIDHIDGNRSNNSLENLRWCTVQENNFYAAQRGSYQGENHGRAKLNNDDVRLIRGLLKREIPGRWIAKVFGVDEGIVRGIASGEYWSHVTENSAKESLEILARAVLHYERMFEDWAMSSGAQTLEQARDPESKATKAIAAVKARGDWPLPDAGKGGG